MKLILTTSPRSEGDLERTGVPFLGLGYVAACIKKISNHQVEIFDAHTYGLDPQHAAVKILEKNPDVIGIHAITDNRFKAIALAKEIKKRNKDIMVLMGGPHFSLTAKNALELIPEIDFILKGEVEKSIIKFLDAFKKQEGLENISGLVFRNRSGEIIDNPITEIINLNPLLALAQ